MQMALIYARVIAGTHTGRLSVRACFRCRRVPASDRTKEIAVDQERDEWQAFEFAAPPAVREADPSLRISKSYILQKERGGSWFVDRWTADGAGAVRAASPSFSSGNEQSAAPANDQPDSCFIIEFGHASR